MAELKLRGLRKSYGSVKIIKGVNLDVEDREFVVFVGPSGCGKSTLLRLIAGLEKITAGESHHRRRPRQRHRSIRARALAIVFQSYALYPHMTVAENMGFALKIAGVVSEERNRKVKEAADICAFHNFVAWCDAARHTRVAAIVAGTTRAKVNSSHAFDGYCIRYSMSLQI